ncbi:hypothetical protein HMPREF3038_01930 [Akkermansia sp. KLE1797]|nr:hypothetical protein HMPREF3038_01930 [Akkermansia sp. KLE1797]KXU54655.1 hypothetical protein HMPREF3039_01127 [Akkermansia sp. KLE1798]KZA05999.1 hypothetical protein HMPREF1326_00262 [Akkermansia sp. KLE1605]
MLPASIRRLPGGGKADVCPAFFGSLPRRPGSGGFMSPQSPAVPGP